MNSENANTHYTFRAGAPQADVRGMGASDAA